MLPKSIDKALYFNVNLVLPKTIDKAFYSRIQSSTWCRYKVCFSKITIRRNDIVCNKECDKTYRHWFYMYIGISDCDIIFEHMT